MELELTHQDTKAVADFLIQHPTLDTNDPNIVINTAGMYGSKKLEIKTCSGSISRFTQGFLSYPITWWANHIHAGMLLGYFGDKQRMTAQLRQNILNSILHEARTNPDKTFQVLSYYAKHKLSSDVSGLIGRALGGVFTTYTTTRLPGQKKSPLSTMKKTSIGLANFAMSSFGAAIYAIAKGQKKFENIISMIVTGDYNATTCIDMGKFRYIPNMKIIYSQDNYNNITTLLSLVNELNQHNSNYLIPVSEFESKND